MLYGADNQPITSTLDDKEQADKDYQNIPTENFPPPTPKPEWFDAKVTEIGGYFDPGVNKIPKYRVVWGMDPMIKQFAMGKMRMKYVSIVDTYETTKGYNVINIKKGTKHFLSVDKAHAKYLNRHTGELTRNINKNEIIQPVIVKEEVEIGQPWWVVEQFVPPEAFGTKAQWDSERFMINPTDPTDYIDALGEYPERGTYIHWFDILDTDDENRTIYRELDEGVVEWIRANHVANIAIRKQRELTTPEMARKQKDDRFNEDWAKYDREMTLEMLDIKKNKHSVSG